MFKKIFRKRRLKKDRSDIATGLIPLKEIHSAAVLLDAAETGWAACAEKIKQFCKDSGIVLTMLFTDLRKPGKGVIMESDREQTIRRRDINWFGRPDLKKAALLTGKPVDLFLCLADNDSYCIEYLAKSAKARFKIGRRPFDGDPFDLIVAESLPDTDREPEGQEQTDGGAQERKNTEGSIVEEIFRTITDIITKIE